MLNGLVHTREGKSAAGLGIARGTAAYGQACFSWGINNAALSANPFAGLKIEPPVTRDRILTDHVLIAVWNAAAKATAPYGGIVRFLILTGQRREEVAGMRWAEISDDLRTWTIPAQRTKNGAMHVVPLSEPAAEILRSVLPSGDYKPALEQYRKEARPVFPGRSKKGTPYGGWSKSKTTLDTAAGVTGWRLHDLRRTLATGLQRLGVRLEVTEAVLNHISGSRAGIVGVYQRHDWANEKRAALDAWAAHIASLVADRPADGNVIRAQFG